VTAPDVAVLIVGIIGSIAAFRLVTSRNVVRAALYLVVTLAMVGAVYLIAGAEFVGWTQVLIYVGAIVVLLLFALMLTRAPIGRDTLDNQQRAVALIVGAGVLAGLVVLIQSAFGDDKIQVRPTRTAEIGASIFTRFVLPFEVVSVLLLAALIGAIVLARKDDTE
jgi:NADH:ubiquinone oxidoreductase subunit 6 (subunit J)